MRRHYIFNRTSADPMTEEINTALADGETIDFIGLFRKVHEALKRRGAANASEEVLRLRCYERLVKLAHKGIIEKKDKTFRAVPGAEWTQNGRVRL